MIGIYKITNPKGKIYIGQSKDIEKRKTDYLRKRCKGQPKMLNSIKKYGWENHIHEIIEECSIEQLDEREIYWGLYYNVLNQKTGLNLRLGNGHSIFSEETRNKISKNNLGKSKTKQHADNISKARKGMVFTEEHKNHMSDSRFRIPVICIENSELYRSANQASQKLNVPPSAILNICRGKNSIIKGYTFKFANQ